MDWKLRKNDNVWDGDLKIASPGFPIKPEKALQPAKASESESRAQKPIKARKFKIRAPLACVLKQILHGILQKDLTKKLSLK
jgi:hypothetical protein